MQSIAVNDEAVLELIRKCVDNIIEENVEDILAKAGNPEVAFEKVRNEIDRRERIIQLFEDYCKTRIPEIET